MGNEKTGYEEPWTYVDGRDAKVKNADGLSIMCDTDYYPWIEDARENLPRIVACVNACAGMEDPAAEIARLSRDLRAWVIEQIERVEDGEIDLVDLKACIRFGPKGAAPVAYSRLGVVE